jgi:hypothetical protein
VRLGGLKAEQQLLELKMLCRQPGPRAGTSRPGSDLSALNPYLDCRGASRDKRER